MKIIAVFNIKGGVGKTATAVNLAALSASGGNKTLLVDMDPQGASTFYFHIDEAEQKHSKKMFSENPDAEKAIMKSKYDHLDIIPADHNYRKMDNLLSKMKDGKKWLRNLFKPVSRKYDYVILDCPPSITLFSENILRNADMILVPVIPTTLSTRTYDQLVEFVNEQKIDRKKIFPFFSMYERRKNLHNESITEFASRYHECIDVAIPYISDIERMGVVRKPYVESHPHDEITYLYKQLWKAVRKKVG
ncbi:MAG: ParA family protein [Bacteroidota bacterium]